MMLVTYRIVSAHVIFIPQDEYAIMYYCISKCELYWCQPINIHVLFLSKPDEYAGLRYEPKMTDLMNKIAVKLPKKWQDIGRGLGLEEYELKQIHEEHGWQQSTNVFFSSMFEKWHLGE